MIKHYFILSVRSIVRNKVFSLINITGLTVGLMAFFLITQYVSFETGFDRFHSDYQRLFRVVTEQRQNGEVINTSATSYLGVRQLIQENFPDVKSTGFSEMPFDLGITFGYRGKPHWQSGRIIQADSGFFNVFPHLLAKGNPGHMLREAREIVLSEKIAKNTFGDDDPLQQQLEDVADLDEGPHTALQVSGVFRDLPADSHLHFDVILPLGRAWDTVSHYWDTPGLHTYIRVPENTSIEGVEARLNMLLTDVSEKFPNIQGTQVRLQPITDIHLRPGIGDELEQRTDVALPLILSAIAICILFIAWINYINLEMARFVTQAREVGVRRVIGSTRRELALQFVIRYFCLNIIAFTLAVAGLRVIIPHLSYFTGIPVSQLDFSHVGTWTTALLLYLAGSILAGAYPVLLLLKLNPAAIMKGTPAGGGPGRLRTSLVVVQYVTSISLIVFVTIANQQLDFMKVFDKKIDIDRVLVIENPLAYTDQFEGNWDSFPALMNVLQTNPAIGEVSCSSNVPGRDINFTLVNEIKRSKEDPYDPRRFKLLFIDYNYIPLYGLKVTAGRNYLQSEAENDNTGRIILNEAAVRALGFKSADEAINQNIYFRLWNFMKPQIEIVGILEDHHHQAIKEEVLPTIYFLNMGAHQLAYFSVRLNKGANTQAAIEFIEGSYKHLFPQNPFNYFFAKDLYEQQFDSEIHFARIFGLFSWVASFLACLGILGITLFETNRRLKEISIRKVLGASGRNIITLLSKNSVGVVFISLAMAVPLAYYASSQWLMSYPVRIGLTALPFVIAAGSITLLTFIASAVQTFKAAQSNPIDHLKNE
jgi:putative ABC transport system permease protein